MCKEQEKILGNYIRSKFGIDMQNITVIKVINNEVNWSLTIVKKIKMKTFKCVIVNYQMYLNLMIIVL